MSNPNIAELFKFIGGSAIDAINLGEKCLEINDMMFQCLIRQSLDVIN
jgi:hypothetical protein